MRIWFCGKVGGGGGQSGVGENDGLLQEKRSIGGEGERGGLQGGEREGSVGRGGDGEVAGAEEGGGDRVIAEGDVHGGGVGGGLEGESGGAGEGVGVGDWKLRAPRVMGAVRVTVLGAVMRLRKLAVASGALGMARRSSWRRG